MRERRIARYILSIILALAMVIGIAVFTLPATTSADAIEPSESLDGSGTEADPYQIGSVADWLCFANMINGNAGQDSGYFQLTDDITFNEGDASEWGTTAPDLNLADYGGVSYIAGKDCSVNPFVGTLDGNGHTISGVYINKTGGSCGLFGSTAAGQTATIKNLIITNSYYESDSKGEAGALIGQLSGGETYIDCVFVTDSVYIKSAGTSDGGFVGHCGANGYGDPTLYIDNSVNGATVDGGSSQYVGGFLGNGNGKQLYINNCLNYGTVKGGTNYLAGLVGRDDKAGSEFNNCVNIGTITPSSGSNYRQIVMSNSSSKKPILTNCLALTTDYGKNVTNQDGSCAQLNKNNFLTKGFLSETPGDKLGDDWVELAYEGEIPGGHRTVKEICVPAALVDAIGSDAIRTNLYSCIDTFPAPQWILDAWEEGTITITTTDDWKDFAQFMNGEFAEKCTDNMNEKTVLLGADLDFGDEDITDYIVGKVAANSFKGTFDGQGHSISGVYMKKTAADGDTVGLFGFTNAGEYATLQNLIIKDSYFESEAGAVGALIAQTAGGSTTVSNVYVDADVEIVSGDSYAGGLVGHVGGNGYNFIGSTPGIIFDSCVNAATVTSTGSAVGGILGNGNGKSYTVSNCLNMGDITGSKSVGGIVGYGRANANIDVNIEYCVNVGVITSASSTNVEKACAITSMGTAARDTLTSTGCYYLNGTATYGVFEGSGESEDGGATAVGISALIGETLPAGLEESGNWIARGDGTVFEICIPSAVEGFAPEETSFRMEDNTPVWLKSYATTTTFTIETVEQWKEIANFFNGVYTTSGTFEGKTILLGANLTFNEGDASTWLTTAPENDMTAYMIGNADNTFKATFDGQGHTISGWYMNSAHENGTGVFGVIENATVQSLVITNSCFKTSQRKIAAAVGQMDGTSTVANIYVTDSVYVRAQKGNRAGIVSSLYNSCDGVISNCVNAANISVVSSTSSDKNYAGGILANGNSGKIVIEDCLNLANITGSSSFVSGIAGCIANDESEINRCVNLGTVQSGNNNGQISSSGTSGTHIYYNDCFGIASAVGGRNTNTDGSTYTQISADAFITPGFLDEDGSALAETWTALSSSSKVGDTTTVIKEICIPTALYDVIGEIETTYHAISIITPAPAWLIEAYENGTIEINSADAWIEFAKFFNGEYDEKCEDRMEGKTLSLVADITFNEGNASEWGTTAPENDMTAYMIGSWTNPFMGTFDGNGYTISGFYGKKAVGAGDTLGLFGSTTYGGESTLQNVLITNSYFECGDGNVGALIGQIYAGTTFINNIYVDDSVYIISNGTAVGGVVGHLGQGSFDIPALYFDSCVNAATVTSTANSVGGMLGNSNQKNVYVSNCLNLGAITGANHVGGMIGYTAGNTTDIEILIEGCVNVGTITGTGTSVAAISTLSTSGTRSATSCYYFTGSAEKGVVSGTDNDVTAVSLAIIGGATLPENLDGEKWIARGTNSYYEVCIPAGVEGFAPAETSFRVEDNTPGWLKGYADDSEFTIKTVEQWMELANFIKGEYTQNGDFEGKTVLLAGDIDFTGADMTEYMLGTMATPFAGTFDGQGYTISGFSVTKSEGDTAGVFGSTAGGKVAVIQNLKIAASHFEAPGAVGALIGQTSGGSTEIYNIYVATDVEIISTGNHVGGIVGHVGQNGFQFIEGRPALKVDSCYNAAAVAAEGVDNVGGILGNANNKNITINNCLNSGAITGGNNVGGIIGNGTGATTTCTISIDGCVNVGTITATGSNVAAIASLSDKGTRSATNCYYLIGSAANGVVSGKDNDVQAASIAVIGGANLPENLDGEKWIARGEGDIYEICIPAGVDGLAPDETDFRIEDNTPDWLKNYADTDVFTIEDVDQWKDIADFIKGEYTQSGDFEGKTILLANDIDFENEDMAEYMLGTSATPFAGTFDGQGYTISGFNVTKDGETAGLFAFTAGGKTTVIQNFIITASHFEAAGSVGAIIGQTSGGSTELYNIYVDADVVIISTGSAAGGLVGHVGANGFSFIDDTPALIVDSCVNAAAVTAEDQSSVGGILGNANNKNVAISNCLNLGAITGGSNVGGILGYGIGSTAACTISIDGCVNVGTITGSGAAIANLSDKGTRSAINCYYLIGTAETGVVSGKDNDVQAVSAAIIGGETLPANLDSDKWMARGVGATLEVCIPAAVEAYAPAETSFRTEDDTPEWLRNYESTTVFTITTVEQWKELASFIKGEYMRAGDFEGKIVYLGCEIDFTGEDMTDYMLGSMATPFAGTFDGQGNAIIGFSVIVEDADTAGVFGSTAGGKLATIRDLVITDSHFEAKGAVGALIGQTSGGSTVIENVYVTATVEIVSNGNYVGGLVGHVGQNGYQFIDGEPALSVNACVNAANITTTASDVGGILGNSNTKVVVIANCLNVGDITGYRYVGGIVGLASDTVEISYCINAGDINGTSSKNYFAEIATGNVKIDNVGKDNEHVREITIANCYYTDIKAIFANEATENVGTINLEDNTPYFAIPTVDWEGWTAVEGGLPTPMVIADVLTISKNVDRSVMLTGASARISKGDGDVSGIRFTAKFSKGYIDSLGENARFGILIAPKTYVDQAGEFTIEALEALRAELGKVTCVLVGNQGDYEFAAEGDEYYLFNAVLGNIRAQNYEVEFCAKAVVIEDRTAETFESNYSDFNATNNTRSIAYVAQKAYEDTVTVEEDGIADANGKGYIYEVESYEEDIIEGEEVVDTVTKYVYSPYTAAQRELIYNFFHKEEVTE